MAALLAVHGLTTPGLLAGDNGVVAFTGAATLPVGGAVLALSALPEIGRPRDVVGCCGSRGCCWGWSQASGSPGSSPRRSCPGVPRRGSTAAWIVLVLGLSSTGARHACRTHVPAHAPSRRPAGRRSAPCCCASRCVPALLWGYHGPGLVARARVRADRHRPRGRPRGARPPSRRPVAPARRATCAATELVAPRMRSSARRVRALLVRLAEKDAYTETHTRGVALRAVQVGEELGLPRPACASWRSARWCTTSASSRCRTRSCRSPSSLDDEEFAVIKRHPEWGSELLRRARRLLDARLRPRARPPRAPRRLRLSARAARRANSTSRRGCSPSATSSTR